MPVLHLGPHPTRDSTIWPDLDPAHTAMDRREKVIFFGPQDPFQWISGGDGSGVRRMPTPLQPALLHHTAASSESPFWGTRQALGGPRSVQLKSGYSGSLSQLKRASQARAPSSSGVTADPCSTSEVPV